MNAIDVCPKETIDYLKEFLNFAIASNLRIKFLNVDMCKIVYKFYNHKELYDYFSRLSNRVIYTLHNINEGKDALKNYKKRMDTRDDSKLF